MLRQLITASVLAALFSLASIKFASAQAVIDKSISADSLSDLPVQTETYAPGGHWFNWTFSWTNRRSINRACVRPRVFTSDMTVEVCNNDFPNGGNEVSGTNYTDVGPDYLQIWQSEGPFGDFITSMLFRVHYFNKQPTRPGEP